MLPTNVAYEVTRILHDNITEGTGTAAYTGCYGQAGKTGTTDKYVDAWFDGYQPNLATSVWVGYPQSNEIEMSSVHGITVFGGTFPADIWNAFYSGIGVPCEYFRSPPSRSAGPRSRAATPPRRRLPRASRWPGRTRRTQAPRAPVAAMTRTPTLPVPAPSSRSRPPRRLPHRHRRRPPPPAAPPPAAGGNGGDT